MRVILTNLQSQLKKSRSFKLFEGLATYRTDEQEDVQNLMNEK